MSVGENIRSLRKSMNMTQDEFAHEIGISRSYLGDLENNRRNPSSETLKKISKKLGVSLLYLLQGKVTFADQLLLEKDKSSTPFQIFANESHNRLLDLFEKVNINNFTDTQVVTLSYFFEYLMSISDNNESEKFEQLDKQLYALIIELGRLASDDERLKYKRSFDWLLSDIASSCVGIVKESKKIVDSKISDNPNHLEQDFNPNKEGKKYFKKIIDMDQLVD